VEETVRTKRWLGEAVVVWWSGSEEGTSLRKLGVLVTALVLVFGLAACEQTTEGAQEAYDEAVENFHAALLDYESLDMASTEDAVREAEDALASAWSDVESAAADLEDAQLDDLQSAYDDLEKAIEDVPSDATVEEALEMLQPQVDAVREAWEAL
jgi:tetratricopeptide (TPR) repeat protein